MKRIKLLLLAIIMSCFIPNVVLAASGKITVSSASTAIVGNTITVTVKVSGTKLGSWEMDLNYNDEYLKFVSSTSEGGGTAMNGVTSSVDGVSSKSYTFKFKALKSGSTKISIPSYYVLNMNEEEVNITTTSKTIKIMTQSELEATYSSDAYLKSLRVGDYELSPKFDKNTYEYTVEVENDITSVKVSATENDSKSTVSGTGEYTLEEGNNKIEIEVTAQKGNSLTYVVNVYRKELDPIVMEVDGSSFTVIRKSELLPNLSTYSETSFMINEFEVPGLKSDITGYELIGLKDESGNIFLYLYDNDEIKGRYVELKSKDLVIYPTYLEKSDDFKDYKKRTIEINAIEVEVYSLNEKSNQVIFYGHNVLTGDYNFYLYDIENELISIYDSELKEYYEEIIEKYKYVVLGAIGVLIILMFIIIVRKPKVVEVTKTVTVVPKEDNNDEIALTRQMDVVNENVPNVGKKKKKKKKKKHQQMEENNQINEEIKPEVEEVEIPDEDEGVEEVIDDFNSMSPKDQKKLLKQQKKLLKEERKREKARKEFDF